MLAAPPEPTPPIRAQRQTAIWRHRSHGVRRGGGEAQTWSTFFVRNDLDNKVLICTLSRSFSSLPSSRSDSTFTITSRWCEYPLLRVAQVGAIRWNQQNIWSLREDLTCNSKKWDVLIYFYDVNIEWLGHPIWVQQINTHIQFISRPNPIPIPFG